MSGRNGRQDHAPPQDGEAEPHAAQPLGEWKSLHPADAAGTPRVQTSPRRGTEYCTLYTLRSRG